MKFMKEKTVILITDRFLRNIIPHKRKNIKCTYLITRKEIILYITYIENTNAQTKTNLTNNR